MLRRGLVNEYRGGWSGAARSRQLAIALTLTSVLAVVLGIAWQWSADNARTARVTRDRATAEAAFIGAQADLMLREGDLAGLRRLMLDLQAAGLVESCRIELAGIGIVASTDPGEIGVMSLPGTWAASAPTPESKSDEGVARAVFDVPGKGAGSVVLGFTSGESPFNDLIMRAGVLAGVLIVGLGLGFSRVRSHLAVWTSLASALRSVSDGERRADALRLGESFGPLASSWNTMLDERDALDSRLAEAKATEAIGSGASEAAFLPAACDSMAQGIVVINPLGQSLYANGAAAVLLGISKEDAATGDIETIFAEEDVRKAVREVFETESSVRNTVVVARGENKEEPEAEFRISVRSTECGPERLAAVYIEDITQQRLADRSRNAFVAQATHELRTPLTNIRLYVEQAIDEGDDPAVRAEAINVIGSESRRLERIISDMLSVSEIEAGSLTIRPSSVRTDALFDELKKDYAAQASEKSIELVFDLPPKFPVITADRDRLGQALHNLIGNAIKYTPPGGKVTVQVETPQGGGMDIAVIDTGIGIDPDECERIFERFYRADDRRIAHVTGSGLGLALAREIARLHGGEISVSSQINEGSTFTLHLPGVASTDSTGPGPQNDKRAA